MPEVPRDGKVWVESKQRYVGGQGANAARAMSLLGMEVSFVSRLGDDPEGGLALADYAAAGLDMSLNAGLVTKGARTMSAVVTVATATQQRTCLMHRDPHLASGQPEKAIAAAAARLASGGFDYVYTDGHCLELALPLAKLAVEHGVPVIADLEMDGQDERALVQLARHLVAPLGVVQQLAGETEPGAALEAVAKGRQQFTVVATDGPNGAYGLQAGTTDLLHTTPANIQPVDTTGAGDAFHAGYLVGLVQPHSTLPGAMEYATRVAAAACLTEGPVLTPRAVREHKLLQFELNGKDVPLRGGSSSRADEL